MIPKIQVHLYLFQQDWSDYIFIYMNTECFWSTYCNWLSSWDWARTRFHFLSVLKPFELSWVQILSLFQVKIHHQRILIDHTTPLIVTSTPLRKNLLGGFCFFKGKPLFVNESGVTLWKTNDKSNSNKNMCPHKNPQILVTN